MANSNLIIALDAIIYTLVATEFIILLIRAYRLELYSFCKLWAIISAFIIISNLSTALQFYSVPLSELKHIDDKEALLMATIHSSALNSLPSLIFWHNGFPFFPLPDWREVSAKQRELNDIKCATWQQICISCVVTNLFVMLIAFVALKTKI